MDKRKFLDADTLKTGGLIVGLIIVLNGVKSLFARSSDDVPEKYQQFVKDKYQTHIDTVNEAKKNFNINNLSFEKPVYTQIAEDQFRAMNQYGTDEDLLFSSLDGLNKDDLVAVFAQFGLRAPFKRVFGRNIPTGERGNIFQWYQSELGPSDLKKMREIWKITGLWK